MCFRNVDTMDLFMLPRDIRCRMISLLLGAVKIERDQHIVSHALYCSVLDFALYCTCFFVIPGPLIEGLPAKRAYIGFWLIFIFCRIELVFHRLTCFDMKSIVLWGSWRGVPNPSSQPKFGPNPSSQANFCQNPSYKSLEFSVCITALFALTYLISSTILRETFSEAIFIFPSQYLPAICKLAELVRWPGKLTERNYATV